jgi:predicted metal-dependent phosphotriesterase family hydrolase
MSTVETVRGPMEAAALGRTPADERPSYLHLSTQILPVLLERGAAQGQIDHMLVDNPRRAFAAGTAGS